MRKMGGVMLLVMMFVAYTHAHMFLSSVYINGEKNTCVRPHPNNQWDFPISDRSSKRFDSTTDMICGWPPALQPAPKKCPVPAGTSIQLQWWHAFEGDDVVDGSHRGPCLVYMARSDSGQGQVWFKIYEEGYNPATKEYCTDRIRKDSNRENKGRLDVTIPSDLAPGNYLLRSEFWALHEGYAEFGAQPYVGCLELTISGSGNSVPSTNLIDVVGYYKPSNPGLFFNIYNQDLSTYPAVGPALYRPGTAPGSTTSGSAGSTTGSPTSSGGSTTSPSAPSNSTNCSEDKVGYLGCQCSGGKFCNNGLGCVNNMCLPVECPYGHEKCTCAQGDKCLTGLTCLSGLCVKPPTGCNANSDPALKSGGNMLTFSDSLVPFLLLLVATLFSVAL